MSLGDLLFDATTALVIAGAFIISYRALRLSAALVDRPYRVRAVGTGIGALTIVAFYFAGYVDGIFGNTPTTAEGVLVEAAAWGFTFVGLLFWIVTNNNVAISADYFNRDALYWRAGGKWVTIGSVLLLYGVASVPPWWIPQAINNSAAFSNFFNVAFTVAIGYAAIVLAITVIRIKDRSIRNYTKWVLLSIVLMWSSIGASTPSSEAFALLSLVLVVAYLYSMNHTVTVLAIRTRTLPT